MEAHTTKWKILKVGIDVGDNYRFIKLYSVNSFKFRILKDLFRIKT